MRRRGARPTLTAVTVGLLIAVLMAIPSAGGARSATISTSGAETDATLIADYAAVSASAPYPLSSSWMDRVGYNASALSGSAGVVERTGTVEVVLTFWPRSSSFFTPGTARLLNGSSSAIADRYGLSESQYGAIEQYFASQGVTVLHTWPDRLSMSVEGPASSVGRAFGTTLLSGVSNGRPVDFPSSVPTLPAPFDAEVAAVSGLSGGSTRLLLPFDTVRPSTLSPAQSTTTTVTANAIHVIYGLDALYNYSGSSHFATGQSIAVLLWGWGYDPADLQGYFAKDYPSQFPAAHVMAYPIDGAPPPGPNATFDPSNATRELTLDIEWAATEAPGATIDAVYAPDGLPSNGYSPDDVPMEDATSRAIGLPGVSVLSMSFGSPDGGDLSFQAAMTMRFDEAANSGISVLAASGDTGGDARPNCQGGAGPQFPASSPAVLSVGGTAPVLSVGDLGAGDVTGLSSEPAWAMSGGGYSTVYAAPSWQLVGTARSPIEQAGGGRGMPDVSGPAASDVFYYAGGPAAGEGTSFSTPMWAGLIAEMDALAGKSFGFITERIYDLERTDNSSGASGLVDITNGAPSCIGMAAPGWDPLTGWGTPRALALFEHLAGTYVDVNLTTSPAAVAPGGSFTVTVVVTNATSHQPIADLPVNLTATGSFPISSWCGGALQSATLRTDASGTASSSVSVPLCFLGGSVSVVATVESNGYLGGVSILTSVSLFGSATQTLTGDFPFNVVFFVSLMLIASVIGLWISRHRKHRAMRRGPSHRPMAAPVRRPAPPPPPNANNAAVGSTSSPAPPTAPVESPQESGPLDRTDSLGDPAPPAVESPAPDPGTGPSSPPEPPGDPTGEPPSGAPTG